MGVLRRKEAAAASRLRLRRCFRLCRLCSRREARSRLRKGPKQKMKPPRKVLRTKEAAASGLRLRRCLRLSRLCSRRKARSRLPRKVASTKDETITEDSKNKAGGGAKPAPSLTL